MADDNNQNPRNDRKSSDPKIISRGVLLWILIFALIGVAFVLRDKVESKQRLPILHRKFVQLVESNSVVEGVINYNPQSPDLKEITGKYKVKDAAGNVEDLVPFKIKTFLSAGLMDQLLNSGQFKTIEPNTFLIGFVYTIAPILLVAVLIYFFLIRQIKMAGKGALSFGKSKARMLNKDRNKITFKDVAGVEEAKDEVLELVEFLKDPKKFQKLGGRIPKGILMIGPPGTGKTLLARAIAGEADASFFSISGSDFVEMFVGVGASRVRDMFDQARRNTPCLVFIDEIDAVGRSRGHGLGGGNDEREQTLNALLVEMDGFDTQEGIIIIAATNRPDVLDPALLRPGRFDRQIVVNLPDVRGREAILKVHARKVKLDPSVDLSVTARATPGYSGAELANLLNEAALQAARQSKKTVTMVELEEARIKVRWGRERRSLAMSDQDKKRTAWHEAGHALVNVLLPNSHPLHKVTIIPRGQSLGSTMSLPKEEAWNRQRKEMLDMIAITMAGRIAEELYSGDVSTGASGDIQQATQMARAMVCQYGMSDRLGMVQYGDDSEFIFLGRDMVRTKAYSESTARGIDAEIKRIIGEGYQTAKSLLENNRDKLEVIAQSLLEFESLDGIQVAEIIRTGKFTPPSAPPSGDPPLGALAATPLNDAAIKEKPKIDAGLASPSPAPA
jgi:cell division protease FtsH